MHCIMPWKLAKSNLPSSFWPVGLIRTRPLLTDRDPCTLLQIKTIPSSFTSSCNQEPIPRKQMASDAPQGFAPKKPATPAQAEPSQARRYRHPPDIDSPNCRRRARGSRAISADKQPETEPPPRPPKAGERPYFLPKSVK